MSNTLKKALEALRRAGTRTAVSALVLFGVAPAAASQDPGRGTIGERIQRVRHEIHEQVRKAAADQPAAGTDNPVLLPWGNWGNWANWGNWNNWAKWNNWNNWAKWYNH